MITPGLGRNIQFRVDTLYYKNGNRVGRIKPDENGIYKGLPMMILGETTQQQTYYEPTSLVDQIVNPNTHFNKIYTQQKAYGEWGHPNFYGMSDRDTIQRLVDIDQRNVSHLFTGIYTDTPMPNGNVVIRADVKPTGEKGAIFKESMDDPVINTAFSLRAFVDTKVRPDGVKEKITRKLCTWDSVGPSGYATTDKAHGLGLESFQDFEINVMENGNLLIDQIALESFSDTEFNELFGSTQVMRCIQSRTIVESDRSLLDRFPTIYPKSMLDDYFKES